MTKKLLLLAIAILFILPSRIYARTVLYAGAPITVKVAYLSPTEVKFVDEKIVSIIMGLPAESISLQNTHDSIFIQPLIPDISGDIYVVTASNKTILISLTSTAPQLRDRSIKIASDVTTTVERIEKINRAGLTPAGLIKAMILEEDLDGVSVRSSKQTIIETPIKLTSHTVYDAVFMRGYIVELPHENIDIKAITMRGLIAGAVHNGRAYFVVEVYR